MLLIDKKTGVWSYHSKKKEKKHDQESVESESKLSKLYQSVMKNVQFKPRRIPYDKWIHENERDIAYIVGTIYDTINTFTYETSNTDEFIYVNIIGQKLHDDLTKWLYHNSINSLVTNK